MPKVLVNIHGAGKQMSDFCEEALTALTHILGLKPAHFACWYADLSNIGAAVRGIQAWPLEAEQVRAALMQEIAQRQQEMEREERTTADARRASATIPGLATPGAPAAPTATTRGLVDIPLMGADVVADVVRYLFDTTLQKAVQQRLSDKLEQATKEYDEILLVSHSLGTVVAFDVLRQAAERYNVKRFVTMGSPLRKLVTVGCRSSDLGTISRKTVPSWLNLYDTTDLVADVIGPAFPGYPIEDTFIQIANLPIPSHDYWRNQEVLEIIADWLR